MSSSIDSVISDVGVGHPALGVPHRGRRVVVAQRAEVAVAVDQRQAHRERLRHAHQGVVDRRVAVRVQLAHDLADDAGALHVAAVGAQAHLVHLVDDAAVHRLQAVAGVGQGARVDDRVRVLEEGALHLVDDVDVEDALLEVVGRRGLRAAAGHRGCGSFTICGTWRVLTRTIVDRRTDNADRDPSRGRVPRRRRDATVPAARGRDPWRTAPGTSPGVRALAYSGRTRTQCTTASRSKGRTCPWVTRPQPQAGSGGLTATEHRLANGLRVVLSEDHLTPVAAVCLWYDVGSRHEVKGRTGLAHLFEHLMFQGSAQVKGNGHFELVQGAGGSLNGTTSFERTNYFETMPTHQLELALWLEADRMGSPARRARRRVLENQRDVVKNERRQRYDNVPYGTAFERLTALAYPEGHPYHHTPIGSMADLDAATLEDARAFFRTYYAPNNAVLSVVGDIDPEQTLAWIEKYFGSIPAHDGKPPPRDGSLPDVIGEQLREVVEEEVPGARPDGRLPAAARRHPRVRRRRPGAHRPRRRRVLPAAQPAGAPRPYGRRRRASACCGWPARPRWAGWT